MLRLQSRIPFLRSRIEHVSRPSLTKHTLFGILAPFLPLSALSLGNVAIADTAFCNSLWLKQGTQIKGILDEGKANLNIEVLSVDRITEQQCQAKLNVTLASNMPPVPLSGQGVLSLNYNNGNNQIDGIFNASAPMNLKLQARIHVQTTEYALLKPVNLLPQTAGKLGAFSSQSDIDGNLSLPNGIPMGELSVQKSSLSTSTRHVSALKSMSTPLGIQQCQTITYMAKGSSGVVNIPALSLNTPNERKTVRVTELYCPAQGLTLKSEFRSGNDRSVFEITQITTPIN